MELQNKEFVKYSMLCILIIEQHTVEDLVIFSSICIHCYELNWTLQKRIFVDILRSMVSKMVEPDEYGKIFTFTSIASSLTSLVTSSGFQEIYAATIDIYPGAFYLIGAGLVFLALVTPF